MVEVLVVIFLSLLALTLLTYILQPLQVAGAVEDALEQVMDELEELYARRDALYQAIKDLEMDYQAGKLNEEDYHLFRQRLRREAAEVLRAIDHLVAQQNAVRERLETLVKAMREQPSPTQETAEELLSAPAYCSRCGHRVRAGDRFCSQCGAPLQPSVADAGSAPR